MDSLLSTTEGQSSVFTNRAVLHGVTAVNNITNTTTNINENSHLIGASGPQVLWVVWTMTSVAACFLAARLYVKLRHGKGVWWDDHLATVSWGILVLFATTTTYCVRDGLGSHSGSSIVQQSPLQLGIIIATVFSALGAAWSKTSFAFTLLRLARQGNRVINLGIWCVVVTLNVVLIFNALMQFFWCTPARAAWSPGMDGVCWERSVVIQYMQFAAFYSAAMDFVLATVPVTLLMHTQMVMREKIGVIVCMSLGVFAGCTAVMRAMTVPTLDGSDYSYQAGLLFIWTGVELATTIVAASIPFLRALVREARTGQYHDNTELSAFKSMGERGGIQVTRTTTITRTSSKSERARKLQDDEDGLLTPLTPLTPAPTYHSYVQTQP